MSNLTAIDPSVISIQDNELTTTSNNVANIFGKRHTHVLEKIENLECSPEFIDSNFSLYVENTKVGAVSRDLKYYQMTKDGFMFLTNALQRVYTGFAGAKSSVGIRTPIFKECLGAHSLALFLCLLLSMADRLQAPLGGRFSLSGGTNLFSVCHPIRTSVVDLNNQRGINHV